MNTAVISSNARHSEEVLDQVLDAVAAERERQEQKHRGSTCASKDVPHTRKFLVLMEEVGEVAQAINDGTLTVKERAHLRAEIIQVAAVAVAWAESLTPTERSES